MLLTSLMWELECLLHEYLCYNWDRIDDVLQANEDALRCHRHMDQHCSPRARHEARMLS